MLAKKGIGDKGGRRDCVLSGSRAFYINPDSPRISTLVNYLSLIIGAFSNNYQNKRFISFMPNCCLNLATKY